MTKKSRKYVTAKKKVEILKKLRKPNAKMSDICQEYQVQPSDVYGWEEELFSRAHEMFEKKRGPKPKDRSKEQIAALESKLSKRDNVLAELMQAHCELKKSLGEI